MELFEENSVITTLLPSIIDQCLIKTSNYEVIKKLVDEDVYIQFTHLVDEQFDYFTIEPEKNLQLMMVYGELYIQAVKLLDKEIVHLDNGIFKIIDKKYAANYTNLQFHLLKYGITSNRNKLYKDDSKLIYIEKLEVLADLNNWYCECDGFMQDCFTDFQGYEEDSKYTTGASTNFITQILANCPSRLLKNLPMCCHLLVLLMIEGNKVRVAEQ